MPAHRTACGQGPCQKPISLSDQMTKSDHKQKWLKRNMFAILLALLEGWYLQEQDRQLNTNTNFIMTVHLHPRGLQHLGTRWHTASSVCLMAVLGLAKLFNQCFGAASQEGCGNGWGHVGNGKSQLKGWLR